MDSRIRLMAALCLSSHVLLAQTGQPGRWESRKSLPTPRQEIAHVVVAGKIFVPGGLDTFRNGSRLVEVFDPQTNAWQTAAALPVPLHHYGAAVVADKIYVLGGYLGSTFSPVSTVHELDPRTERWETRQSMPAARGAHAAVTFAGKIYIFGGVLAGAVTDRTEAYDPATDSWQRLAAMPTAREHLAAATIDSLIYVIGGRNNSGNVAVLEAYSPATGTWRSLPPMPTARGGLAAAALRGRLFVFGGEIPGVFEEVEAFDPATQTWETLAPMPTPRHGIGAAVVGDSIFIIGGADRAGFGVSDANELFIPPEVLTGTHDAPISPTRFSLAQNYPNPFNATTIIVYTLPRAAEVEVAIFSLAGRRVRLLQAGHQPAGSHAVRWDGSDQQGRTQSTGIYFYHLRIDGRPVASRKMVLAK